MAQRILILGSPGSGKSTLAIELGRLADLPVVHLDALYLGADWVDRATQDVRPQIAAAVQAERWIIDGNYSSTYDLRVERADLILFLDLPMPTCLQRVVARTWRWRGRARPGLPPDCRERLDLPFLLYVAHYPGRGRRKALALLESTAGRIDQRIFNSQVEVDAFLESWAGRSVAHPRRPAGNASGPYSAGS